MVQTLISFQAVSSANVPSVHFSQKCQQPVSHHYIEESLHLRVSFAVDSWKDPSRKTSKRRIVGLVSILQLSGAAAELPASGRQFSCLYNETEPERVWKGFCGPLENKNQEERCLVVSEEFLHAPVLNTVQNKRKDVTEEPIIVICLWNCFWMT